MRNFKSELKLLKKVFLNVYVIFKKGTKTFGRAPEILYASALLAPIQKVKFLALLWRIGPLRGDGGGDCGSGHERVWERKQKTQNKSIPNY